MIELNRGPRERLPRLELRREDPEDVERLSAALERLVPLGLRVRTADVYPLLGFERPDGGDDVLEMAPAAARAAAAGRRRREGRAGDDEDADADRAIAEQARAEIGPLIDGWIAAAAGALADSSTPEAFRAWIDAAPEALDAAPVRERLAEALAAADLAGRAAVIDEADGASTATAAAAAANERLSNRDRLAFFRGKISVPTRKWTDIWEAQHDTALVVAGAARDDLLSDLRAAVGAAVDGTLPFERFKAEFVSISARHGWSYKGGADWRARTIYRTNVRQSYMAGRVRQLRDGGYPYWRYVHASRVQDPRPEHLAWHGLVLRADDPFWVTRGGAAAASRGSASGGCGGWARRGRTRRRRRISGRSSSGGAGTRGRSRSRPGSIPASATGWGTRGTISRARSGCGWRRRAGRRRSSRRAASPSCGIARACWRRIRRRSRPGGGRSHPPLRPIRPRWELWRLRYSPGCAASAMRPPRCW